MSKIANLRIDVVSDSICPFCFLGLRKQDLGLELFRKQHPDVDLRVTRIWHPYQLDARLNQSNNPISKTEYYHRRYGVEWLQWAKPTMRQWSNEIGLDIVMEGNLRSTIASHRLFKQALKVKGAKIQDELVFQVFSDYFEKQKDIGDPEMLSKTAVEFGIFSDHSTALNWIQSVDLEKQVQDEAIIIHRSGIVSVPYYQLTLLKDSTDPESSQSDPTWTLLEDDSKDIFIKKLVIPGSQDKQDWAKTLSDFLLDQ